MAELLNDSFPQEEEENDRQFDRWSEGSRDEFWDALSSNYDYLMDDGLIATCREASSDLSVDEEADSSIPEENLYTFSCFMEQFRKLHDLLHDLLQGDTRRKEVPEDRQNVATMCRLFNEHAKHLSSRHPHLREEIHRHLNLLNNKWLAVQASFFGHQGHTSKDALFHEIAGRMKSLRKWLRDVEGRLSPVPSVSSPNTLKDKHNKQTSLQKEIEEKGRCVHSLVRACARLEGSAPLGASLAQWDAERVRRVAKNLEHRWHALWLASLERQCALEEGIRNVGKEKLEASFSEEPLTKYPRLSDSFEAIARLEDELKMTMLAKSNEVLSDITQTKSNVCSTPVTRTDKGIMVGDTGIAELKAECNGGGKFEIIQDVGYSSETSAHFSTDDKTEVKDKGVSPTTSYLKTVHMLTEERAFKKQNGCKSVPETFYKMACVDDLAEDDDDENDVIDHPPKTSTAKKKSRQKLERPNDLLKRSVCDWLDKCHLAEGGELKLKSDWALKVVDTSCDASGECTNDSDSEKSNSDVNNSVAFSQSFTGSIETVIPSTTEPSPVVRLRNKKRRTNRGRPWSVIELKSMAVAPSVSHSTSEGALDTLHRSTYISSRRKKRLSLSDISSPCTVPSPSTLDESKTLLSETNSLVTTTEDQASISDQAWDEYQDPPYLSEPYSEQTIDEEKVRRLLSFGDDYGATLGSYSDGSSVSLRPTRHRSHRKVSKSGGGSHQSSDTNSDCEDFQNILETSGRTLLFVGHSMEEGATASKHAELIATTQTNLCLLKEIAAARCELESLSKEDVQKLQDLISEWEELQSRLLAAKSSNTNEEGTIIETQEISDALATLKGQLGDLEQNAKSAIGTANSIDQLNANIEELQCALSQLQDMKAIVLQASAKVLRLAAGSSLRESATQLYQRWEDVYELNCTQLTKLQKLQSSWGKPTEEELEESLETTVQWQPPPVDTKPTTAEMCVETHHLSLGAQVQESEAHNPLQEIEAEKMSKSSAKESVHNISSRDQPKKKRSFSVWRILLASFPFQLLLLLLLALASYTEPQCCEHANNFDFYSLKLRYLEGPPPV